MLSGTTLAEVLNSVSNPIISGGQVLGKALVGKVFTERTSQPEFRSLTCLPIACTTTPVVGRWREADS